MIHILVVEDDIKLNQIICTHLHNNGYAATACLNAIEAYERMHTAQFEFVLSDIMMPGMDGFEFAKSVRAINTTIPILFMSARDDISSKQKGFHLGIDDYIVKPVNLEELVLRIGAVLRRSHIASEKKLKTGDLILDSNEMSAYLKGEEIPITVREFNILFKMLSYPKHTFSRAQLMDEFWGIESNTSLRAVDIYITKLRDKFSDCTDFKIITVYGLGYKAVLS